jgi:hypothetical protein
MKPDEKDVTDLTREAGIEESKDSELFANLSSRAPTASGLHRRPREALAQVARLGALVPSPPAGRSIPPPPGTAPASVPASPRSAPPRLSSAAPVIKPAPASSIQSGAFDDDEVTPGRRIVPVQKSGGSRKLTIAIAAGTAALVLLAVGVLATRSTGQSGSLIVTATGPGSSEVAGVEVLVDGEKRCSGSPCKIAAIGTGTHLVSVRAEGFNPTAPLAVTVTARNESVLNVALATSDAPATAAAPAKTAMPSTSPEPTATAKPAEVRSTPAAAALRAVPTVAAATNVPARSAASATQAAAPASSAADDKAAFGTLRIASLPVASVLLDGRPIGRTPQVIRVSPGQHRVAIVAGEDRRAQTVTVAPGATQVVSVRF